MKSILGLLCAVLISFCGTLSNSNAAPNESSKAEINVTRAVFGSGTNVVDVTGRITELLRTEPDGFSARGDWLKVDPLPYKSKALGITYDYKGKHYLFVVASTQKVSLQLLIENTKLSKKAGPLTVL